MIKNTFSIIKGVGQGLEKRLWMKGLLEWADFISAPSIGFISPARKALFDGYLAEAGRHLDEGDSRYFARTLRRNEHWRLFDTFRDSAVCLDIETNGWQPYSGGYVTVVGLYDGRSYRAFVRGENLTTHALERELSGYRYLITFFGTGFDMPFLRESLGVCFEGAHFDLCFGAKRLGLKGGLKRLEETLGFHREDCVKGLDGYDAVKLWNEARRGNRGAMELLITYNRQDTVNLMGLAETLYRGLKSQTGIEEFLN